MVYEPKLYIGADIDSHTIGCKYTKLYSEEYVAIHTIGLCDGYIVQTVGRKRSLRVYMPAVGPERLK
jgi:hypothetical protein